MGRLPRWRGALVTGPLVVTLALAGCTASGSGTAGDGAEQAAEGPSGRPSGEPSGAGDPADPSPGSGTSTPGEGDVPPDPTPSAPEVTHPVSLPALMASEDDGRALRRRGVLARTDAYTRHAVTYRSGDLTISGIMNVPAGSGPFPVVVMAHGYIEPSAYVTGQGLSREQDWLARRGYVALHVDYRNHAGSDDDPRNDVRLRLGYTEDVLDAVDAVKRSDLPFLDGDRVALLGRSMGGGVVQNALVVRPGLVDAAVVFASVSSDTVDNFDRWTRGERPALTRRIVRRYGAPEENPAFWRGVSPRTYVDRVTEPLLVHHGTADSTCPIRWSRETVAAFAREDKRVRFAVYQGEEHAFVPQWPDSMRRTTRFLDRHLG